MVGLVPKVLTIFKTGGTCDIVEGAGVAADTSSRGRKGSDSVAGGSGGGGGGDPKVCGRVCEPCTVVVVVVVVVLVVVAGAGVGAGAGAGASGGVSGVGVSGGGVGVDGVDGGGSLPSSPPILTPPIFFAQQVCVEAARLVRALCNGSDLTLQTLISCGGLAVLAQFLDAGPRIDGPGSAGTDARRLVRIGIDGVLKVFSLQVSICDWLMRSGA